MHLTFNPPTPTFPDPENLILSEPDANASVRNWVDLVFRRAVNEFGQQPDVQPTHSGGAVQSPRKYANFYLRTAQTRDQVRDIGNFAVLDETQKAAVAHGTAQARFIDEICDVALDANNHPSEIGGEAWPGPNADGVGGVTFANPVSLWNGKKAAFNLNLAHGADGTNPAPVT
jgi:hypothetical protein